MVLIVIAAMAFALVTGALVRLSFIVSIRLGLLTLLTFIGGGAYIATQGDTDALFGLTLVAATMGTLGERIAAWARRLKEDLDEWN